MPGPRRQRGARMGAGGLPAAPGGTGGAVEPSATVCAIATAPAAGGIGVIRISGPLAVPASLPLAPRVPRAPEARRAYFTELTDRGRAPLDQGLFLFFAAPNSYTGEDVVELQAHGGPRLLSLLLREVLGDGRVRLAEAGEFSRQAFLNGRMDLTRAEAVATLVSAESEAAVRAAASQLSGSLAGRVREVRAPLADLRADLEGALAFPDEAEGAEAGARARLSSISGALAALLADARRGALVRRTARAVLYGPVNAGKSTLFNRLAGEERALVDPEPGTTRDLVEARLELGGYGLSLVDTAGLRPARGGWRRWGSSGPGAPWPPRTWRCCSPRPGPPRRRWRVGGGRRGRSRSSRSGARRTSRRRPRPGSR